MLPCMYSAGQYRFIDMECAMLLLVRLFQRAALRCHDGLCKLTFQRWDECEVQSATLTNACSSLP